MNTAHVAFTAGQKSHIVAWVKTEISCHEANGKEENFVID